MLEKISKFLFFLTCLFPIVSARLPLSDMFNFEIKKYIPYIIVSTILLIAFMPIPQLKKVRIIISLTLNIFTLLIFPPLFFYTTQGFTKFTIVFIALNGSIIASIIITWLIYLCTKDVSITTIVTWILAVLLSLIFPPLFSYAIDDLSKLTIVVSAFDWAIIATIIITWLISRDGSRKMVASIIFTTLFTLIFIIFPPLFLYATESFNNVTIIFLILFEFFIFTILLTAFSNLIWCIIIPFLVGFSIAIYAIVVGIGTEVCFSVTIIVINLVLGFCLSCLQRTIIGSIIISYILGGIDFFIIFYALQNQVNPISLLLFWADLWTILFDIYTGIEKHKGEGERSEVIEAA
ncbi:hypothetical protein Glove_242g67 [Diversispora epigaea]|uniref:DUF4203 domain-containing protein n=1 Tax=Diversispora epigaea TaxID=1348612 RepID=A0A397IHI7_9GLOM|nr:hypothetical protein Glove_242g67 [Diversispora epigaea]